LQIRLFIKTQDHLLWGQWAGVQLNKVLDQLGKVLVAWHFRREPQMISPRFEFMRLQDTPDGLGGNALHDPIGLELTGQV
jgi:hypothetical protein